MLSLYRRLIAVRRASPALCLGDVSVLAAENGMLVYERRSGAERLLVALNLTPEPRSISLAGGAWTQVISTQRQGEAQAASSELALAANEGMVLRPS